MARGKRSEDKDRKSQAKGRQTNIRILIWMNNGKYKYSATSKNILVYKMTLKQMMLVFIKKDIFYMPPEVGYFSFN